MILVVGDRRERSRRALQSVLGQEGIEQTEVILIDAGSHGSTPLPGADHPAVRLVAMDLAAGFGRLKAEGVRRARAPLVAFIEDHAEARPGWLQGVLQASEGPWAAIGAEVHNANAGAGLSQVIGTISYGLWSPPLERGEAKMLAGNNTVYRRELILNYGDELDELLISDTVLQAKLAADGHKLLTEPKVSILHRNPTTLLSGMKAEFFYHWCFGAARARSLGWTRWQRMRYLALSPLIPWVRLSRLVKMVRSRQSERHVQIFQTALVAVFLLHAAVSGQAIGIILGLRGGLDRFTRFELNGPRPLPDA